MRERKQVIQFLALFGAFMVPVLIVMGVWMRSWDGPITRGSVYAAVVSGLVVYALGAVVVLLVWHLRHRARS